MFTVSAGRWIWNDALKTGSSNYEGALSSIDINFTSNGEQYIAFALTDSGENGSLQLKYVKYVNSEFEEITVYNQSTQIWEDEAYKTMVFAEELVLSSQDAYEAFMLNASKPLKYTKLYREDNLPYNILEATDDAGMTALEADENSANKIVKFTGTDSSTYNEGRFYICENVVQIIQFSIDFSLSLDTVTFQAEEGMTWGEWIESAYNNDDTLAFTANTSNISISYNNGNYGYSIDDVGEDDTIINGNTYTAKYTSGGAGA